MESYIMSTREKFDLNCSACRVLLNATPGLKTAGVFKVIIVTVMNCQKNRKLMICTFEKSRVLKNSLCTIGMHIAVV